MERSANYSQNRLQDVGQPIASRYLLKIRDGLIHRSLFYFCIIAIFSFSSLVLAQPPGTQPPQGLLVPNQDTSEEGVPIRAFMFLSESGNPVMMPSLTWEEFERYLSLDSGREKSRRKYNYQSLEITGSATGVRAELLIRLKLVIDPTEGGWVNIPMRLGNFHQLEPVSLEPSVEAITSVSADGLGYRLFVRHNAKVETDLIMRVSARVDFSGNSRSLRFQLPDVPTKLRLKVEDDTSNAEVVGQGDEIVEMLDAKPDDVELRVESSGGDYTLRWGRDSEAVQKAPIYEVESRTSVRWNSPTDQPIVSVRLSVNNLRGTVEGFILRLPQNAVLLDAPALADTGQVLELGPSQSIDNEDVRELTIPSDVRQERLDLAFEFQLGNQEASSESPLQFLVPDVIGALRHRGEVEVLVPSEYRLRWGTSSSIRRTFLNAGDVTAPDRSYRFTFERPDFVLPLWLGANQRQFRLNSRTELTTRDKNATLWMQVEISGETSDGLIRFDDAGWEVRVVESQLGTPLVTFSEDDLSVVDISSLTTEEASQLIFQFQKVLSGIEDTTPLALDIPRIIIPDKASVIRDSRLKLVNDGRRALVVDLEASRGLTRITEVDESASLNTEITSFRMIDGSNSARIVGSLIEQPTSITLTSDVQIELDGNSLNTNCDWIVSTLLDLEGRLAIRIPFLSGVAGDRQKLDQQENQEDSAVSDPKNDRDAWNVTVDELPAQLKYLGDDQYELISDRLTSGTMRVRFRNQQQVQQLKSDSDLISVSLPRPAVSDMALRGSVVVSIQGDEKRELVAVDNSGGEQLELSQIPRDPLRLRLTNDEEQRSDIEVGTTIVRSLLGSSKRFDQVLARVRGGELYEVNLAVEPTRVSVVGFVDGESVRVTIDGSKLMIPLGNQKADQLVDLRIWFPQEADSFANEIIPLVKLDDPSVGLYWQVITPRDSHVVWASSMLSREMAWRYDRWKLYRDPSYSDQSLLEMVYTQADPMPDGNRYLYRGYEVQAFRVFLLSRVVLWFAVGMAVILVTVAVTTSRAFRHPAMMVTLLTLLSGLGLIAPDAVILAGQYALLSMILVVVMFAVRVLIRPHSRRRIFSDKRGSVHSISEPLGASPSHSIQTLELVVDESDSAEGESA